MNLTTSTALVQILLSCHVLFPDGRNPTSVKMTSFQLSPTEGITVHTWTNSTEGEVKKIKFDEKDFDRIRIQMMEKDGRVVLGGQVGKKQGDQWNNCPVTGDLEELRLAIEARLCNNPDCYYRMRNMIYKINENAGLPSLVFAINGSQPWAGIQYNIDCSSPLGQSPNEDVSVFTVNGECKQINHSVLNISWTPTPCLKPKIELEPNVYSKFYHLRYLLSISGCGQNMTDSNVIDNTYVKFLFKPTEPPPTAKLDAGGDKDWVKYVPYGAGGLALIVALICIVLYIVFRKKIKECCKGGKWKPSFCKKKEKEKEKPQVIQYTEAAVIAERDLYGDIEKANINRVHSKYPIRLAEALRKLEEKKAPERQRIREKEDRLRKENPPKVKVGEKLKTFKLGQNQLVPAAEMVVDEQTKIKVPKVLRCTETYNYSKYLGSGSIGKVFMYTSKSTPERSVAVKIVHGKAMTEAEKEIQLMGEIQSKFGQFAFVYLLEVLEAGQFPDFLFIMMPMYHRTMEFFMPGNKAFDKRATFKHQICVAWEYLKGIQQLHSLGYGHNDISPRNFMQIDIGRREIVLCNFGLVKRLGSERTIQEGTYLFLSFTAFDLMETSIVDDYQSWLFIVIFMVRGKNEWTPINERNDVVLADLHVKKQNFFYNLPTYDEGSDQEKLLYLLAAHIVDDRGPETPVEVDKVIKCMKDTSFELKMDLSTFEWHLDFKDTK